MKTLKQEETPIAVSTIRAPTSKSSSTDTTIGIGCTPRLDIRLRRSSKFRLNLQPLGPGRASVFSGMERSIDRMEKQLGSRLPPAPQPIRSMSLQLAIPWRVGLHQSPPPLHQPGLSLKELSPNDNRNPANGILSTYKLSHPRGSPQRCVKKLDFPKLRRLIL
jgi:hypothetical protein